MTLRQSIQQAIHESLTNPLKAALARILEHGMGCDCRRCLEDYALVNPIL